MIFERRDYMIPSKDTSRRFASMGGDVRAKGFGKATTEQLARAKSLESEITALDTSKRDTAWCDKVSALFGRISNEGLIIRYKIGNLARLCSMLLEASKIRATSKPTTDTPVASDNGQQTKTPTPPTRTTTTTTTTTPPTRIQTANGTRVLAPTLNIPMLVGFNVPSFIFLALAFIFPGAFNIHLGIAMFWFLVSTAFCTLGSDTKNYVPEHIGWIVNNLVMLVPLTSSVLMVIFYLCSMPSTGIFTWIGTIGATLLLACQTGSGSIINGPKLGCNALHMSFTLGALLLCLYLQVGWVTWLFGILAMIITVFMNLTSHFDDDYISEEWYVSFLYIPAFIFGILAVNNGNSSDFGTALICATIATLLNRLFLKKSGSEGAELFRLLSGYLVPIGSVVFASLLLIISGALEGRGFVDLAAQLLILGAIGSAVIAFEERRKRPLCIMASVCAIISVILYFVAPIFI